MTAEIHSFPGNTLCELEANDILEAAKEQGLDTTVIVGWTKEGELYVASTTSNTGNIFLLLDVTKASLLEKMLHGN